GQKLEPRRNARKRPLPRRQGAERKTKTTRKEAAKKAPPRLAERTKAKPTAKVAVKPRPVSQRTQPETVKPPSKRMASRQCDEFGAKPDLWPAGRSCPGWIDFVILISAFDRAAPCKSTFTVISAPFTYNVNPAVIIK